VNLKYLARLFACVLLVASCVTSAPSPEPTGPVTSATPTSRGGLPGAIAADVRPLRRWHTVPDGLHRDPAMIGIDFAVDPGPGDPVLRIDGAREMSVSSAAGGPRGFRAVAPVELTGLAPGEHRAEVLVRLADGSRVPAGATTFVVSAPEYVVWTLDFEGDVTTDARLANTAAIADGLGVPMTLMWNPRVWTTDQVSSAQAAAMLAWTKGRAAKGDEVALHIHMWTDFVRAAGLTPRTSPSWAGRGDGYDVPLTAFTDSETKTLLEYSLRLMAEHDLPRPRTFRAGGQFANAGNLRALAAAGFVADCSAVPAGTFGRLSFPWTLAADAQPYRPSPNEANVPGDLALLEAPTIGGNTFGHSARTIEPIARANLSFLAAAGVVATERRAITLVSHPSTIDATERAAIEALLDAFAPLRYDRDAGPLRFVTLAQLAQAYSR
jgi:hypothetical protein